MLTYDWAVLRKKDKALGRVPGVKREHKCCELLGTQLSEGPLSYSLEFGFEARAPAGTEVICCLSLPLFLCIKLP